MRVIFSGILLATSIFFTVYGTRYEYVTSSGQVGAGFFPLWLGGLLIVFTAITFAKDLKLHLQNKPSFAITENVRTMIIMIVLTILFIGTLQIIGAVIGMILYTFAVLFVLNRQRMVVNTLISILVPLGTYYLLDVWLNAGFPEGIFGF
ncbi:tripartite tricarboxylate transporter TctB family protein [Halalkalibacter oceani]|uniref:Tripartite tricarboxylate transporter TctB family protein n=1 Tax=Halalkalibacter oceani TaxID=1653776 RepID=A0A9X2DP67_9BACI|nr:tripartite tricarboxylate transporter TctB family protein [Halalkalibacter oceani]MCM3712573.1 tripartite tricarboxylate transporter TctB family protein [Halalkalibacter oceani]MCM3762169.1 tripartite tricarboxylate transporter TctB family protein [Halalkalibacter oceani]